MSGKSGKIAGKDNVSAFEDFIARTKMTGWQQYILPGGRGLNKTAISKSCRFARSVFVQNPSIKLRCAKLVDELVSKGILKADCDDTLLLGSAGLTRDEAVKEFTDKLAELENAIADLMRVVKEADEKAAYYETEAEIIIKGRGTAKGREVSKEGR